MKMRALVGMLAVLVLSTNASPGQNLLINGDFETVDLPPWTLIEGGVTVTPREESGFRALSTSSGTISQTIATEIGAAYRVSFLAENGRGLGTLIVRATPVGGAEPDGTTTLSNLPDNRGVGGFTFFASTETTAITVQLGTPGAIVPTLHFVDDLAVVKLVPSPFAGRYKGTATRELLVTDSGLAQQVSHKIVASVDEIGRIVILRDAAELAAGQLFADGKFSIRFGDRVEVGDAVIKEKRIEISYTLPGNGQDDFEGQLATETNFRYVLSRRQTPKPR